MVVGSASNAFANKMGVIPATHTPVILRLDRRTSMKGVLCSDPPDKPEDDETISNILACLAKARASERRPLPGHSAFKFDYGGPPTPRLRRDSLRSNSWRACPAKARASERRLVRTEGFEPSIPYGRQILSLLRIPVPPRPHPATLHSGLREQWKSFAHRSARLNNSGADRVLI